jgi:tetratricopeptide (TPR) repeat protein
MKQASDRRYVLLIYVILVLATVIAFEPLRYNNFVEYDDDVYVTDNSHVSGGINFDSVAWAFATPHAGNWHPLTWLSHMLDCQLFGLNPLWHHLTSLLFHIANTLLLFWVLKRTTDRVWLSAFVAAVFALHPLHVESVAWVAERKDVLSGFFWMLTIIAYVRYAQRPAVGRYLLVILALCLGLMAKPMVVTLPFVLLLLDYWPLCRFRWAYQNQGEDLQRYKFMGVRCAKSSFGRLVVEKIPLFALVVVSAVVTFVVQQGAGAMKPGERFSLGIRIANALVSYLSYIARIFYPTRLAVLYPHPGNRLPVWQPIVSAVILVVISAVVIYMGRRWRYFVVGWLWYLGTLVPVIGLVQVGSQAMADRYTYLPSIGIFIIVAWGTAELLTGWRYRRIVLGIPAVVVLSVLLICTRLQAGYWKENFTLFGHALEVTENNSIMHNNFGNALRDKGRFDEAVMHFDEALRINPQYLNARNNKAKAFLDMGRADEAIVIFSELVRVSEKPYEVYNDLGMAYAQKGKLDLAIENYNEALKLKPDYVKSMNNLGWALKQIGKIDQAIKQWEKALKLEPDYAKAHYSMGLVLAQQGKYDDAIKHFSDALRTKPDWAEAHYNLGGVYARQGKLELAVMQCEETLRLKPDYLTARVSLAYTLLHLGEIRSAVEQFYKILQLKPDDLEILNVLAWLLATTEDTSIQNPSDSVRFAQRACELTKYQRPDLLDTLAAAYAVAGRFSEAVEIAEKVKKMAEDAGQKEIAEKMQTRLQLYKANRPYRQKMSQPPNSVF